MFPEARPAVTHGIQTMSNDKPTTGNDPRTATATTPTTSSTVEPTTGKTTDRVQTRASGRIHCESFVDAFRVLAGSEVISPEGTLIQLSTNGGSNTVTYDTAVAVESIDPRHASNVIITGTERLVSKTSSDADLELFERVTFQTPYEARGIFQTLKEQQQAGAEFIQGIVTRWTVETSNIDYVITRLLEDGFTINIELDTLRELYDAHPDHTIADGEFIAINEALTDPDYYESDAESDQTGHSKGGNPHDARYFLEHGECPADGCESEFETFRSLRGHIGGSVAGEDDIGPHSRVNLRLNDLDIAVDK